MKHEDCEQFLISVGRCFVVEALLEFFHMSDSQQKPKRNGPNMAYITTDEQKKLFIESTLDKFLEQFVFIEDDQAFGTDSVCHYSVNLVKSFMILADIKDAVATEMANIFLSCISFQHLVSTNMQSRGWLI